jgi:dTMP kinase
MAQTLCGGVRGESALIHFDRRDKVFLTLEGVEGCGKTSQARMLAHALRARGVSVLQTREPGGSPIGGSMRSILLSEEYAVSPRTELLLYAAERAEHVRSVIRPALARGELVLCDRFGDATRAYQAWGRGLPRKDVEALHSFATEGLEPDMTLYLRLSVEGAIERARLRDSSAAAGEGRFEAEALDFHRRVAQGYEALALEYPDRIVPVDAEGSREAVAGRILEIVEAHLGF